MTSLARIGQWVCFWWGQLLVLGEIQRAARLAVQVTARDTCPLSRVHARLRVGLLLLQDLTYMRMQVLIGTIPRRLLPLNLLAWPDCMAFLPEIVWGQATKGHECRMSGPRFRPLDIFGRIFLRCSFRPKLVERHVARIFQTTQDSLLKKQHATATGHPGRPSARPRGADTGRLSQGLFPICRSEAARTRSGVFRLACLRAEDSLGARDVYSTGGSRFDATLLESGGIRGGAAREDREAGGSGAGDGGPVPGVLCRLELAGATGRESFVPWPDRIRKDAHRGSRRGDFVWGSAGGHQGRLR